jgi:hypothetical protein
MLLPIRQISAQLVEVELGKRSAGALEIAHGPFQNRARTQAIALGFVMEGDCQLNQTLHVQTAVAIRRAVARQRAPDVLQNFVSVEEMGSVEKIEASLEAPMIKVKRNGHSRLASADYVVRQSTCFHRLIDDLHPEKCIHATLEIYVIEKYDRYLILFWNADCTCGVDNLKHVCGAVCRCWALPELST